MAVKTSSGCLFDVSYSIWASKIFPVTLIRKQSSAVFLDFF